MDYQKFVNEVFKLGKAEGFDDMEVYFQKNNEFETTVFKTEVDKFSISEFSGLSFRGLYQKKMGYAYTEILDADAVTMLVKEAKENAEIIESDDEVFIAGPQTNYQSVDIYNEDLNSVSKAEKIKFLKLVEEEALKLDPRIQSLAYNLYADYDVAVKIKNTKGMELDQNYNLALAFIMALAVDNGENKTSHVVLIDRDFKNFDYKKTAKEVVDKTVALLGAKTVPSKAYPVIFKNDCAASLLGAFQGVFNAEIVQKDLSLMKGRLNEPVASPVVNLIDDPFMSGGFGNSSFDAEGTPTSKTTLIKNGVLNSYLHNLKTAKKDGVASTGNAAKRSYKASINIAPTNLFIDKGQRSLENMTSEIAEGLIITKLDGLHSGLNTISGDFSLAAIGYLVKDGKIERPVDQITVAGNLKDLLMDIEEVGSDLVYGLPQGNAFIASPSLRIKSISVAGE